MTPSSETVDYGAPKVGALHRGGADWMRRAVQPSHRGRFRGKAARAGLSTLAYARKERHASGTLGKEARLALAFAKVRPKKPHALRDRLTALRSAGAFRKGGR